MLVYVKSWDKRNRFVRTEKKIFFPEIVFFIYLKIMHTGVFGNFYIKYRQLMRSETSKRTPGFKRLYSKSSNLVSPFCQATRTVDDIEVTSIVISVFFSNS